MQHFSSIGDGAAVLPGPGQERAAGKGGSHTRGCVQAWIEGWTVSRQTRPSGGLVSASSARLVWRCDIMPGPQWTSHDPLGVSRTPSSSSLSPSTSRHLWRSRCMPGEHHFLRRSRWLPKTKIFQCMPATCTSPPTFSSGTTRKEKNHKKKLTG